MEHFDIIREIDGVRILVDITKGKKQIVERTRDYITTYVHYRPQARCVTLAQKQSERIFEVRVDDDYYATIKIKQETLLLQDWLDILCTRAMALYPGLRKMTNNKVEITNPIYY